VQKSIVQAFPNAPIRIAIVWADILPSDSDATARKAARNLSADPRIRHFRDPHQLVPHAVPATLGWTGRVYDIYLFYPKGSEWKGKMPRPAAYLHQYGPHSQDGHFFEGDDLARELQKATAEVLQKAGVKP
jgi:hypothetical protein